MASNRRRTGARIFSAASAEPERDLLRRQAVEAHVIDVMELALEAEERLRPEQLQHLHLLGEARAAAVYVLADRPVLGLLPADADAELEAAATDEVEFRRLLGNDRRLVQRQDQDRRNEVQAARLAGEDAKSRRGRSAGESRGDGLAAVGGRREQVAGGRDRRKRRRRLGEVARSRDVVETKGIRSVFRCVSGF
jgi:hypothetical protein